MTSLPERHESRSICALANGLEIVGDRWTLLIIRDLMFTNRNEFGHLLQSGEGISTNILTERLERLQQYHILEKLPHPTHGKKFVYRLTDRGLGLLPVLLEMVLWAHDVFDNSYIPPHIHDMMVNDRQRIIDKVNKREPLVTLDL